VCHLVDLYGQARVVTFYRAVASDPKAASGAQLNPDAATASAFPHSFGVSEAQFVNGWRLYLRTLAHTPG
jgi:hypothetical protein